MHTATAIATLLSELRNPARWGTPAPYNIVSAKRTGMRHWLLVDEVKTNRRFVSVDLLSESRGQWSCLKSISMDAGPCYYDCPPEYLEGLTPTTVHGEKWVENAGRWHARQARVTAFKAKLQPGATVVVNGSKYALVRPVPNGLGWVVSHGGIELRLKRTQFETAVQAMCP